ncbi:MAG: hypothetical protein N838_30380 [Thiohalocapsa sp. PB-PSB1]|nr:MAG: hypothetical protein N838_30380 [Thiohalocapsa sp. PB-PSB1]
MHMLLDARLKTKFLSQLVRQFFTVHIWVKVHKLESMQLFI